MYRFAFSLLACSLTLSSSAQTAAAPNEVAYTISQGGRSLGEARYGVNPVAGGEELHSSGSMKLNDFSYSFQSTATVDAQFNLVHDDLSGSVQSAKGPAKRVEFTTSADPTGRQFNLTIDADGKQSSNTVDRHQNLVLLPDLDPAALTLMVHFAIGQPRSAWVLLPKENGILAPVQYTLASDLQGTLNARPVTVRHAVAAIGEENAVVVELFFLPDGALLEADLNAQNLQMVRDRFKLNNRPTPAAPPARQAPPAEAQPASAPQKLPGSPTQ